MDQLIDTQGRHWRPDAVDLPDAVWGRGFIHIREKRRAVIVSLAPALVKGPPMAGAFYAIADIDPERIALITEKNGGTVVFGANWKAACHLICELAIAAQRSPEPQTTASWHRVEALKNPVPLGGPEQIITATLKQCAHGNPGAVTRSVLEQLWHAGCKVRRP